MSVRCGDGSNDYEVTREHARILRQRGCNVVCTCQ